MGKKKDDGRKRGDLRKGSEKELEQDMIRLSLVIISQYLSR